MEIKALKEPQEQETLDRKVLRVVLALKELRVVALKVPLEALELKELQVTQEQMALKVPLEALELKELQVVVLKEVLELKVIKALREIKEIKGRLELKEQMEIMALKALKE